MDQQREHDALRRSSRARVSASANSGIFGGGQMGYNWQANNFVFGLEGTISGLDNKGTVLNTVFGAG